MALVSGGRSTLNPNAPLYIPACMRQVEDFSQEWWNLVTTSTWFRDYWLSQNHVEDFFGSEDDGYDYEDTDVVDLLPDNIDLGMDEDDLTMEAQFEEFLRSSETGQGYMSVFSADKGMPANGFSSDSGALIKNFKLSMEKGSRSPAEQAKFLEKPAKFISPKCSPRRIQQPR
ncbi:protein EARLY RESPONSIVE TO DEHYDRATION 15 [Coffea eugenioides]|uniref:Protein EARLY RESPONSIVE TO DEHYDRATION 15-like n=1 Tax=Coffea arabica TaxID=13443 RepID=A0A6P6T1J1_COFAR|nr:protein EARLY RESPONSIVE TO DEHYDRATION 15-like [Coffea arabica]XP_027175386.1 protein EARLY RESPONSIVE TO DEHYDRATION 15 [Coffea eugenioides]